jgi:hypothetical protein
MAGRVIFILIYASIRHHCECEGNNKVVLCLITKVKNLTTLLKLLKNPLNKCEIYCICLVKLNVDFTNQWVWQLNC